MHKYKNALILVGVLVGLVALAYWDEWETKNEEQAELQKNRVLEFEPDSVVAIEFVDRIESVNASLELKDSKWNIVAPIKAPADSNVVSGLLQTMSEYKYSKIVTSDQKNWTEYGVAEPIRTVKVQTKSGEQFQILLGDQAPVGYSAYVRIGSSDNVFMGSQHILTSTAKKIKDFRDKRFFQLPRESIKAFSYFVGENLIVAAIKKNNLLQITNPSGIKEDRAELIEFLEDLGEFRAQSFVDQPDDEFLSGIAESVGKIRLDIEQEDGRKTRLNAAVVADQFWVWLDSQPPYFEISSDSMKRLTKTLMDFRDRSVIDIDASEVKFVSVNGLEFIRKGSDFYSKATDGKGVKQMHIQNLVADLAWAKAENFLIDQDSQALAEKEPDFIIKLSREESGKNSVVLKAWSNGDQGYDVSTNEKKSFASVSESVFFNTKDSDTAEEPSEPEEMNNESGSIENPSSPNHAGSAESGDQG